uniref:Uncharacterized protein n=1 Tax=Arundo donax TaxID=35708 RepID=A0A0A8XXN8_ARUDO
MVTFFLISFKHHLKKKCSFFKKNVLSADYQVHN